MAEYRIACRERSIIATRRSCIYVFLLAIALVGIYAVNRAATAKFVNCTEPFFTSRILEHNTLHACLVLANRAHHIWSYIQHPTSRCILDPPLRIVHLINRQPQQLLRALAQIFRRFRDFLPDLAVARLLERELVDKLVFLLLAAMLL